MSSSDSNILVDIDDIRQNGGSYTLYCKWWTGILELKKELHRLTGRPPSKHHLFLPNITVELRNNLTLYDLGFDSVKGPPTRLRVLIDPSTTECKKTISVLNRGVLNDDSEKLIKESQAGLDSNQNLYKTDEFEGTGGVYFFRSSRGNFVSVFKPADEEQGMPNNPKGRTENGMRRYCTPGEGCLREVAAYILDQDSFSGVPVTLMVQCEIPYFFNARKSLVSGPKQGSLQRFVRCVDSFEDHGHSSFSDLDIQKIALLDIRILNCDRNPANILLKYSNDEESTFDLVPIDHGYAFPTRVLIEEFDWCWMSCPQVNKPVIKKVYDYVMSLDVEALIESVRKQVTLPDESLYLLRCSHFLLVNGLRNGLTLFQIANIIVRSGDGCSPSRLETALELAEENAYRRIELSYRYENIHRTDREDTPTTASTKIMTKDMSQTAFMNQPISINTNANLEFRRMSTISTVSPHPHFNDVAGRMNDISFPRTQAEEEPSSDESSNASGGGDVQGEDHDSQSDDGSDSDHSSPMAHYPYKCKFFRYPVRKSALIFNGGGSDDIGEKIVPEISENLDSKLNSGSHRQGNVWKKAGGNFVLKGSTAIAAGAYQANEDSDSLPVLPPIKLGRVTSFSGFESKPLYDPGSLKRNYGLLRVERRRHISQSSEFGSLRLELAKEAIMSILNRTVMHMKLK